MELDSYVYDAVLHKFTGKERDPESGLDNFGARYNASSFGRFTSPDPLLNSGQPWNPQSWNRYAYTENNPLRYTDPTGLWKWGTCKGSIDECEDYADRFRDSVAKAKEALKGLDPGSKEAKQLKKVLDKLGNEGEGKIKVSFGDAGQTNGLPNPAVTTGNNITINYAAVDRMTGNLTQPEANALDAGISAHEATHAGNLLSFLLSPSLHQHAAYYSQSLVQQGLHITDRVYRLWNESWAGPDRLLLEQKRETAIQTTQTRHSKARPETGGPTMSSRKLAAFFGFASSLLCAFAHAQTPKSDVPLKVTFCDLYSDPKRYSGEMIQVRAAILGYRDPTLEEPMFNPIQPCAASGYLNFGLELPQDVKPMPEFGFVEDESYQKYKEALKSHVQIEATLEGRFDVVFIWRNHRRERLAEGQGFGKKHDKDARLVLHRVLDVETRRVPPL